MAPSPSFGRFFACACYLTFLLSPAAAQRPKTLVLPVTKDASTSTPQYVTTLQQRTPLVPLKLVVDLGGRYMWVDCDDPTYVSSSYTPARCRSARCSLAGATACGSCGSKRRPGCNNDTCVAFPSNPFKNLITSGEVAADAVALQSSNGSLPLVLATAPQFVFSCAPTFLLDGLAAGSKGMAGLGRSRVAPPSQLAADFGLQREFGVCLSPNGVGFVFFGDGIGTLRLFTGSGISLAYTPLLVNPVGEGVRAATQGEPSHEYFVGVTSIKINDKAVPINSTLLSIDRKTGAGGTKISTAAPYTVLETTIYRAVAEAFGREAAAQGIVGVAAVEPFGACFDGKSMGFGREGAEVPAIDLVLQSESVSWRMLGGNSMVRARDGEDVWCLGFVDGGGDARTSVVVGGHQLEDNLLVFDLAASRLGFSSSLLASRTTCAGAIFF